MTNRIIDVLMTRNKLNYMAAKAYLDSVVNGIEQGSDAEEMLKYSLGLDESYLNDLLELL